MSIYSDRLKILQSIYGNNVLCTNGLFHIIDSNHKEIYLNRNTGEIDQRGKYRTVAVLEKTILAEVLNDKKIKYVLLDKRNLECLYKTTEVLNYVDNNIIYDTSGVVLSHTGKELIHTDKIKDIRLIADRYYLVSSEKMFNDKILEYIKPVDKVTEYTKDKKYNINLCKEDENSVDILNMVGGKYRYDLRNHKCFNFFTQEENEVTQLWTLN